MNKKSKEKLCDSNNTNSNQVSTQAPSNLQINEEKPFYLTNQQGAQLENIKQSISNDDGCRCNKISLFFLYRGIINACLLATSLILLVMFKDAEKFEVDYFLIIGIVGAIGSFICVLIAANEEGSKKTRIKSYIIMIIFTVIWSATVGCFSMKIQETVYFTLAIMTINEFVNCFITMKLKEYLENRLFCALGDIIVICCGCVLFIILGGKFKNLINFCVFLFWVVMRVFVFKELVKEFNSDENRNIAFCVMGYYMLWIAHFILAIIGIIMIVLVIIFTLLGGNAEQ